jgi:hypothetical protein
MVTHDPDDSILYGELPNVNEVIFCSRDITINKILDIQERQSDKGVVFRILPDGMDVLIGSNYIGSPDTLYTPDFGNIASATNRRSKRMFDIVTALLLIVLSPILYWPQRRKRRYFADCWAVLIGRKSWVGYSRRFESPQPSTPSTLQPSNPPTLQAESLPALRPGVFRTRDRIPRVKNPDIQRLDSDYANNYHLSTDMTILFINLLKI